MCMGPVGIYKVYEHSHTRKCDQPWHARAPAKVHKAPADTVRAHTNNDRSRAPEQQRHPDHARGRRARDSTHCSHPSRPVPRASTTRTPSATIAPATTRQDDPMHVTPSEGRHGTHTRGLLALAASYSLGPLRAYALSTQPCSGDRTATRRPCKAFTRACIGHRVQGVDAEGRECGVGG